MHAVSLGRAQAIRTCDICKGDSEENPALKCIPSFRYEMRFCKKNRAKEVGGRIFEVVIFSHTHTHTHSGTCTHTHHHKILYVNSTL